MDTFLAGIRRLIPVKLFNALNPAYHWTLAFLWALVCRFPSRRIKVIAVTGTKGKSTTAEILNAIIEQAGHRTAVSNTIRFKIGDDSRPNLYKMSVPGRGFTQRFLRKAVNAGCEYAVIEMTSQGSLLYRHRFIQLDAFVFTNISPEHIEAHGSFEAYREAKLDIVRDGIGHSNKKDRLIVVNGDDPDSSRFSEVVGDRNVKKIKFSVKDVEPYEIRKEGLAFMWHDKPVVSPLSGLFNLYNILAAAVTASNLGVGDDDVIAAITKFKDIPGRVEEVNVGQDFKVIVDYAHTADSLEKLYKIFRPYPKAPRTNKLIAVLGGTGGGRDTSKRAVMGGLADKYCDVVILTDEDPYDEAPNKIVADVAAGIVSKKPTTLMDRRLAIREAISRAQKGDVILITGKGTDPYIMGPRGTKTPWSDARIAREELEEKGRRK
ncbi:MAG: UDP-N-acetylmuramyl-tripeptide synthetase [Patescibacteria group bacterium]|nr:UDP-N-acetylmuramyl-tripeptide synthetase [Patescibacteria group bacterium]